MSSPKTGWWLAAYWRLIDLALGVAEGGSGPGGETRSPVGFEFLEHASDIRMRVRGPSLEETFAQACLGMWSLISDPSQVPLTREWTSRAVGRDLDELLVNLLNELILSFDAEGLVAGRVESVSLTTSGGGFAASAALRGSSREELRSPLSRYLKAATFHGLLVSPGMIEVTLDV